MSKTFDVALPAMLFLSALALSACASKPETVSVAEPHPSASVAEKPSVPEATPEPAAAAAVEQPVTKPEPVTKPVIRKAKKKIAVKHGRLKTQPTPPVVAPAPVEQQAPTILPPETSPPVTIAPPAKKMAEAGFLERYWLWLLGLAAVIAGVFAWLWRSQEDRH